MPQSFYRKTALGLSHEYNGQVGTKGHLAARKLMVSAQYKVLRERGMHWDSAVLPFTPGLSLCPPSDVRVTCHPCVSASLFAEQSNSSSLLGEAL